MPPGEDEVDEAYLKLADSSDYEHYGPYRQRLDRGMIALKPRVLDELDAFYSSLLPDLESNQRLATSARRKIFWIGALGSLLASLIFVVVIMPFLTGVRYEVLFVLGVGVACVVAFVAMAAARVQQTAVAVASKAKTESLEAEVRRKISASVQQAFTQVLNETLGPENKLPFPMTAPRLVELDTSAVVPSSTAIFLKSFVEGHESSAIGIAGPRGSGKSTLMRGLTTDSSHRDRSVWLTAPVRYDSIDFIRRLYLEVANTVAGKSGESLMKARSRKTSSVLLARAVLGSILLSVGVLIVLYDVYALSWFEPKFSVAGTAGVVLATSGFLVFILGVTSDLAKRSSTYGVRNARTQKPSVILAMEAIMRLSYDTETNAKSKNGAKFLGSMLALEDENSITRKDRDLSHADLVSGLKNLLRAFAHDEDSNPVIVVIDELDKISSTAHLIDTINDLKDLFHIEGVHFVVSVSTDALVSFERRGLITRDAFDSSFDTIVSVQALTLDESLQVISARAEGFPPLVGAFCHAWSGGLPRELLRVARRCVEIQRSSKEAQPIEVLVQSVVAEDARALVEASMRSTKNRVKREHLWLLRERTRLLQEGRGSLPNSAEFPESLQGIASVVALAESLCLYFTNSVKVGTTQWSTPDPVREPLEAAAKAMALRGEPDEIRAELFKQATSALLVQVTD